jgi:hypothetical protein
MAGKPSPAATHAKILIQKARSARATEGGRGFAAGVRVREAVMSLRAVGAITLLVLGLAGCGGGDRKAYVKANQTLFRQLPRFPGSSVEDETTMAYHADESGPVAGYSTRFELTLPPQATGDAVGSFYRRRLGSRWRLVENLGGLVLNYRRGKAFLSVNLENADARMLEIAVDHDYYGKLDR